MTVVKHIYFVFKVMVLHLEYPMDKGHNLMVNLSHSVFIKHEHFWDIIVGFPHKPKLLFTAVMS